MLADERVDVVHLATPNHLHDDQVRAVLAAGKHVVCEKPLGMTSVQTGGAGRWHASVGPRARGQLQSALLSQNMHAREAIARGDLGDVRMIHGGYVQDWLLYDTDWSWRLEREQGGDLRVVGDIGSHWLDLAGYLTGRRVDAVMADLTTFMPVRNSPSATSRRSRRRSRRLSTARSRPRTRPACWCASRAARAGSSLSPR